MRVKRVVVVLLLFATPTVMLASTPLEPPPPDAVPVPADYDGDGLTDMALKGSNGIWYIDLAACSVAPETACSNGVDDDGDGHVNDGCQAEGAAGPPVDPSKTLEERACDDTVVAAAEASCDDTVDSDGDGFVNDGCRAQGRCLGGDGYGGRWDFAYPGYGDSTAVPVPADYDGDGKADLAVKDGLDGIWYIDYSRNTFGAWDEQYAGYGDSSAVPVPADYDGDGKADLSVKGSDGKWYIDYSSIGGFGGWNWVSPDPIYGDSTWVPVPADYDGDGKADLAVKTADGDWYIDYSSVDDFGRWDTDPPFRHYGDATAVPVPADYDGDGHADLAVKSAEGDWYLDTFAIDGFGHWDNPEPLRGYGGDWSIAKPGRYYDPGRDPNDRRLDLGVVDTSGRWYLDLASDGYTGWNVVPGTSSTSLDNVNRRLVDTAAPWIEDMVIQGPGRSRYAEFENGHFKLEIGVRYTVLVRIRAGTFVGPPYLAGLEVNPDLHVPASLNIVNRIGATNFTDITSSLTRGFAITCSEHGSFPLGFMIRKPDLPGMPWSGSAVNPDYGARVACTSPGGTGLYGTVSQRHPYGTHLTPDFEARPIRCGTLQAPIPCPTVTVGGDTCTTDADGNWSLPRVTGGPHRVTVSMAGRSRAVAVNVRVPAGHGVRVDTPLEEAFPALAAAGMSYTTYIDYSRGRTILHTLRVDSSSASVKLAKTGPRAPDDKDYNFLLYEAIGRGAPAVVNGCWWNYGPVKFAETAGIGDDTAGGYFFARSRPRDSDSKAYHVAVVDVDIANNEEGRVYYTEPPPPTILQEKCTHPMLAISGMAANQTIGIVESEADFFSETSSQWSQVLPGPWVTETLPVWDVAPRDGRSDVDFALQCWPTLLLSGAVIARGQVSSDPSSLDFAFPRTAVGVGPSNALRTGTVVWLVVADGEGVNGGNGATFNQLAEFFRDVLGARVAMNLDGGESSEMILRGANGPRILNRLSSENHGAPLDYVPSGAVFNYIVLSGGLVVQP